MKKILCIFFSLFPLFALCQTKELNLRLNFHDGNGPFEYALPAIKWNDTLTVSKNADAQFKNIPSTLKNIQRGRIYFNFNQYIYQNFIAGKISKENFALVKNSGMKFNEKILVKKEIKCYVNLIKATNAKNEEVCMVDANNNYDFGDDVSFIPMSDTLTDEAMNRQLIKVECQRVLNGKIISDKVPLLIAKNRNLLVFSIAQYGTVTLINEGKKYKLAVCPIYFISATWKPAQLVVITDSLQNSKNNEGKVFTNGDFIKIGVDSYKFNGVDITKNQLTLQKMTGNIKYSPQVGFYAPPFENKNLLTGKNISLVDFKGKYIYVDFWGTWCFPCRQQLPDLIKLNNSIDSSQIVLISIASNEKLDSLQKFISKEKMTWPQIFSDEITAKYHVSSFPTSILINPEGIIIAKDLSMDDLKQKLSSLSLVGN